MSGKPLLKVNETHIHSGIMANHIIVTLQVSCVTQSVWSFSLCEPESLGLWCVWLLECHYRDTVYRIMTQPQGPITGKDSFRRLEFPQPSEGERGREREKRMSERKKGWRVIRFIPLYAFISEIFPLLTANWIKHAEWDEMQYTKLAHMSSFLRLYFLTVFKAVDYIDSASLSLGKDRIVNECALGGWGEVEGLGWFH